MNLYLVICSYIGCKECEPSGEHVIAICDSLKIAEELADKHVEKNCHYGHSYMVEVHPVELNKDISKDYNYKTLYFVENSGDLQKYLNYSIIK